MKTLLINPSSSNVYEGTKLNTPCPPVGLLFIAGVIEKRGHDVVLIDMDADNINKVGFLARLNETRPDIIGITSTTPTINNAFSIAEAVKKQFNVPIILGGVHPSIAPKECLANPNIDLIVQGEGEETINELFELLESGNVNTKSLLKIKGLWFKSNGELIFNGPRPLIENLDDIPFIPKHLFNYRKYIPPDAVRKPIGVILTTRGCPGACTFCCSKQMFGYKFRARSCQNIIEEIDEWINKYGVREIHILDDAFTFNKKRVLEFCKEIKKKKYDITFSFLNGIRVDHVDDEILSALKSIGVRSLAFGVESGNQQILDTAKKGITLDKIRDTFKRAKKFGFVTWASFIIGLPGENEQTVTQSIEFAKELNPDIAKFLILKPYPGSEVFKQLDSKGLIVDYNYSNYGTYSKPVHYLPELSTNQMLALHKKAYRQFYLRPSKIIMNIVRMKSLHHLITNIKFGVYILKMMK